MDTIIACRYKGGCIIAADSAQARSILIYKDDLDKIAQIGDKIIMGSAGPNADTVSFRYVGGGGWPLCESTEEVVAWLGCFFRLWSMVEFAFCSFALLCSLGLFAFPALPPL